MNEPASNSHAKLSELCLQRAYDLGYLPVLNRDLEHALKGFEIQISETKENLKYLREELEKGYVVMGDRSRRTINKDQHKEQIVEQEKIINTSEENMKALQPINLEINRILWAVSEMYFQDDFRNDNPKPNQAYNKHQAKTAFDTRPYEKNSAVEIWKSDKRTIGEVLATAHEKLEKAIPLIHEGLSITGLSAESERDQGITTTILPISTMAKDLIKRQRPDISKAT